MIIEICPKCKKINVQTLIPKIKELSTSIEIRLSCVNMCGIGRTKVFAIVNHIPIIADTEDTLITLIKKQIGK